MADDTQDTETRSVIAVSARGGLHTGIPETTGHPPWNDQDLWKDCAEEDDGGPQRDFDPLDESPAEDPPDDPDATSDTRTEPFEDDRQRDAAGGF